MAHGLPADGRARQIFEEGAAILERLWDDRVAMVRDHEHEEFHSPRNTLAFCRVLLARGDATRAERPLAAVLALQETHEGDAHRGNFRWWLEDQCVTDLNAVEFVLDDLIAIAGEHRDAISPSLVVSAKRAVALGLDEINRLDVHLSYTNIALSDIANSVLGGELIADARYIARGAKRLEEWLARTRATGAPHEFNSPTYLAVDILRVAALAEGTADARIAEQARAAEGLLWQHVAAHYHPRLAQLAGPHSRSYFDGWSGAPGFLKLLLWRLLGDDRLRQPTPYVPRGREEGHIAIALASLHCPGEALRSLAEKEYPFAVQETSDAARNLRVSTFMTPEYAIGSATRTYDVGDPPERWPGFNSVHAYITRPEPPGYSALYLRYLIDDRAPSPDHWDEGQHVAAQERNRLVVAYGLIPRLRPVSSCKLSLRILGVRDRDEVWVNDSAMPAAACTLAAPDRVTAAIGDAYLAIIPLAPSDFGHDAPIVLSRDGDNLAFDIYNYRGPPRTPWELRSLAGPFYKGNVRNALALELSSPAEFATLGDFREHISRATIEDAVGDDLIRTITYRSAGGGVRLAYGLRDMRVIPSD